MRYHIARNGQVYGPYTTDDLKRYVASGHVLLTDSAKSDEMPEWVPVSQLLPSLGIDAPAGGPPFQASGPPFQASGPPFPPYAQAAAGGYAAGPTSNGPPDLSWVLVLLFDVLTCSVFQLVWNLILAAWFRRVVPSSKVLLLYAASAILILTQGVFGQTLGFLSGRHGYSLGDGVGGPHGVAFAGYGLLAVLCWVVRLVARFTFRADLERYYNTVEPIGLEINPVLTFFFGGIYLQSVMNRINQIKRAVAFGGPR